MAWFGGVLLAAWLAVGFAGQAGDAARAAERADAARAANAVLSDQVAALQAERDLVTQRSWILQQARAYGLGSGPEHAFALAPDAPALAADAPGSAARRLGTTASSRSPLDAWLDVLFGPQR